jgi:hypothetical protein
VHLAAFIDRDIFAGCKRFIREVESDFVWYFRGCAVMECPTTTLAVNKMAGAVFLARAQPGNPASLAMLAPKRRIDPVVAIERRNDDIGDISIALLMTGLRASSMRI